jgi:hypothetical protein
MIPPEAPTNGETTKLLNLFGENFLIRCQSNLSHFVSCRKIISQSLSLIFDLSSLCLFSEFIPLTFQHRMRHFLLEILLIINTEKYNIKASFVHDTKPNSKRAHKLTVPATLTDTNQIIGTDHDTDHNKMTNTINMTLIELININIMTLTPQLALTLKH